MKTKLSQSILASLLFSAMPTLAHHSFLAHYDDTTREVIEGTVTEVWFENPHSRVYVQARDTNGNTVLWETETYPRNILVRRGWNHDDLKAGDAVVVTGRRARDGSNRLQMLTLVRPSDGWEGVGFEADSID